ncbi:MAG: GH25 family lysozyme [Bacteroidota bacterium]
MYKLIPLLLTCFLLGACEQKPTQPSTKSSSDTLVPSSPRVVQPTIPSPPAAKQGTHLVGIDISKFQGDEIQTLNSQKDSLSFIFCKATGGETYVDPKFKTNWQTINERLSFCELSV